MHVDNDKTYLPNLLIADDNILCLNDLENQLKNVLGPDGNYQSAKTAFDGKQLLEMYHERLDLAVKSNWAIKPFNIIITDLHMPGIHVLQ